METFSKGEIRLLVVEDNAGDFVLIEDYLKDEIDKPFLTHATTFSEAKKHLTDTPQFDAILLDLTLPDKNGEPLVNEVVQLAKNIPVVVLTGYPNKDFGIKTLSHGISDYLLKDELNSAQLFKSIYYSIERKRITSQLKESEEKYRNLFHFSPQPMWVFDVTTSRFLNVNGAAVRHYGYTLEDFLSMTTNEIIINESTNKENVHGNDIPSNGSFFHGISHHRKKNGEIIKVDIQSNLIEFDGSPARLVLATDISERMRYIQAIEEQNERFREIAWTQSHIVRAPLARILGLIHILTTQSASLETVEELLPHIINSANELDTAIREIVRKTEGIYFPEKKEFNNDGAVASGKKIKSTQE